MKTTESLPIVAILGRPNVGKSTLLNRLVTKMDAIVDSTSGVTRDRKYARAKWKNYNFIVADTGGVGTERKEFLSKDIEKQAFIAAREADVVVMLVDVRTGITSDDEWLAKRLKRLGKKTILVLNKADAVNSQILASEFYKLGMGEPICISAYHGLGIGELLDRICSLLPEIEPTSQEETSIAIVGRTNAGKSSILNQLAGEERALVHEKTHTTRDTIDAIVEFRGKVYRILDTAGIRKKTRGLDNVEYYGSVRAMRAIEEADVALLVIDAQIGPTEVDLKVARKIDNYGKACVILLNKWDLIKNEEHAHQVITSITEKFRFATHLPLHKTSATTGKGIEIIFPIVDEVKGEWTKRIPTAKLNSFLSKFEEERPRIYKGNLELKIYYATQFGIAPPTFVFFVNNPKLLTPQFKKYLIRKIRDEYGFSGCPVRIHFRTTRKKGILDIHT
ncbi:MAG: ribosome biogenesis GTPase Der [Actinomycetota bacterium]|nr:ribosome biogenesis GTPase Der [Actinomycetota bacterium]